MKYKYIITLRLELVSTILDESPEECFHSRDEIAFEMLHKMRVDDTLRVIGTKDEDKIESPSHRSR